MESGTDGFLGRLLFYEAVGNERIGYRDEVAASLEMVECVEGSSIVEGCAGEDGGRSEQAGVVVLEMQLCCCPLVCVEWVVVVVSQ
jgi:hypothetical protein